MPTHLSHTHYQAPQAKASTRTRQECVCFAQKNFPIILKIQIRNHTDQRQSIISCYADTKTVDRKAF